jgi:shikimate 5-dehydrogenase
VVQSVSLAPLQALVENPLPATVPGWLIALLGDHPSAYSRSPRIWAAALERLGVEATYLALDVPAGRLAEVVALLRDMDRCLGANVTVPYKEAVVPLLDHLDPTAAAIGAVNTVTRTAGGRLAGCNTDGVGLVEALLHPGEGEPLIHSPYGLTVLLIGGGGAARAAAAALGPLLGPGTLLVTNRSPEGALRVVATVGARGARATVVADEALEEVLPGVDLLINASVRGQAGIRRGAGGWTCLEPYSALAPAWPAVLPPMPEPRFTTEWASRSAADIEANHARSRLRLRLLPRSAMVFDMVYAPAETVLLRHAREEGLRSRGGRWMMIAQAAESLVGHIGVRLLADVGGDRESLRSRVVEAMAAAWNI